MATSRLSFLRAAAAATLAAVARPLGATAGAPALRGLRVGNGASPRPGDSRFLASLSPRRRAGRAIVRFRLDEPATVKVEAVATGRRGDRTVWSRRRRLGPGAHAFEWQPPANAEARTYLMRTTVRDERGRITVYGERRGLRAPVVRVLGIEAAWVRRSYQPGQRARLRIEADAKQLMLQLFRNGPEPVSTNREDALSGVPVSEPVTLDWSHRRGARNAAFVWIGDWPSGLYYARLVAGDGRVGYAPFVLRPRRLGTSRVAVVLPTNTWQAYNFRDADGDGWGDTWYAGGTPPVVLDRPYRDRGVPPRFFRYDFPFLRWLEKTRRDPDVYADDDLDALASGDELRRLYDLV
ncbi:MAG TPA: N,N-dimethylformamidase beta subunit family domain-containing protein, partial [Gaiellaceae bacterium]|nr:N,N-dimethylformamidase beta subunit family domain-containing protein [Gaiellaceae bacterium]